MKESKIEKIVKRGDSIYKTNKHVYNFQQFETIGSSSRNIFDDEITLNNADEGRSNLLPEIVDFSKNTKPKDFSKKAKKLKCPL